MSTELSVKNIFVFDANKCVGCGACVVACMNENGFQSPVRWRNIHHSNDAHLPTLPLFYLSLACNHCDDAPCMNNCPALAYSRDESSGAIIHDAEKCIGCKYCTWACPYDAPKYNDSKGVIEKCTFCNQRIAENEKPACAQLCPVGALDFENIEFSAEESLKSSPVDVAIGAHFKRIELRSANGPEIDESLFEDVPKNIPVTKKQKINAAKEWPLVVFSLLISGLVALVSVQNELAVSVSKISLLALGIIAGVLSTLHLGKKQGAWRSVLNLKNSWLSREIMAFTVFISLLAIDSFVYPVKPVILITVGFVLLLSVDRLYEIAMWKWPFKFSSEQTVLIALSAIFLLSNYVILFAIIALIRICLFVLQIILKKQGIMVIHVLRIMFLTTAIFGAYFSLNFHILLQVFVVGELLGRIDFYNNLDVPTPTSELN
ncbi:MAG: 4Fe-4S binding protein [Salinivirgaceae bacterium]|nr:4Fe-4S binding protein [Salinivirgaceae bacterium]